MLRFAKRTLTAVAALAIAGLTACSSVDTEAGSTITIAASVETAGQTSASEQKAVYGKVASLNGKILTIEVGTYDATAVSTSGSSVNTDLLTLTGETLTLTVTEETIYVDEAPELAAQNDTSSETVSLSNIAADSVIRVTYNAKTREAISIVILSGSALAGIPG